MESTAELQKELANCRRIITQLQADKDDLKKRLTRTLALDASANNQELIALRINIADSLRIEYKEYQESKNEKYSFDQYEAYRASLFRIFKALKRYKINFNSFD